MKEYVIYHRHGSGKPYTLNTYKTIDSAKMKLYDIVSLEDERQRPYFVDNDFFNNKYRLVGDLYYLCIMEREVSEWKRYTEEKALQKDNKILYFMNYK